MLFVGVAVIVGSNVIFLTVLQVFDGLNSINREMLVIHEGTFPFYDETQVCSLPNIIRVVLHECGVLIITISLGLLAFLTRNIRRKHFKDTKKVNTFIYLDILISYIVFPLLWFFTYHEIQVYLKFIGMNSYAILCQTFLFLPKCWPPLLRHLKLKYLKTALKNKQSTNSKEEKYATHPNVTVALN